MTARKVNGKAARRGAKANEKEKERGKVTPQSTNLKSHKMQFMRAIGMYRTGCDFGGKCKLKHERPTTEPPEIALGAAAKPVATMATGAVPNTNGGKHVKQEMQLTDISEKNFTIMPNGTAGWVNSNEMWLQPDDETDSLCDG